MCVCSYICKVICYFRSLLKNMSNNWRRITLRVLLLLFPRGIEPRQNGRRSTNPRLEGDGCGLPLANDRYPPKLLGTTQVVVGNKDAKETFYEIQRNAGHQLSSKHLKEKRALDRLLSRILELPFPSYVTNVKFLIFILLFDGGHLKPQVNPMNSLGEMDEITAAVWGSS